MYFNNFITLILHWVFCLVLLFLFLFCLITPASFRSISSFSWPESWNWMSELWLIISSGVKYKLHRSALERTRWSTSLTAAPQLAADNFYLRKWRQACRRICKHWFLIVTLFSGYVKCTTECVPFRLHFTENRWPEQTKVTFDVHTPEECDIMMTPSW